MTRKRVTPITLASRSNLANALYAQGKYAEAEAENRALLKLAEKVLGPEHPDTLGSRNNLANALDSEGKYAEAEAEYRAVLKLREKVLGPEHPDTLLSRDQLAWILATCPGPKFETVQKRWHWQQTFASFRDGVMLPISILWPPRKLKRVCSTPR